jgi:hypothetical protein
MAKKKSAFVMAGEQAKEVVREASKTTRSNIIDTGQIIEALNLSEGQTVSLICKVASIKTDTHTTDKTDSKYDEDRAGLPYVNFQFVPTSGPLKGGSIGNFMACYDKKDFEISQSALEWVFREFQGLDYETEGWTLAEIEEHAEEINGASDKPVVSLVMKCNKIKSGKNKGQLAVNCRIGRLIEDGADDEDDQVDQEPEAPAAKPTRGRKAAAKPVEKAEEDDDKPFVPKIGDKVNYTFVDGDDEEELVCTVTKVNPRKKTCDLSDGEYDYDDVKFDEVSPV